MKKLISLFLCLMVLLPTILAASAQIYSENGILKGITPETTVSELKAQFPDVQSVTKDGKTFGNDEKIGTGYSVVRTGGTLKASVLGDLNGDAKLNSMDFLILKKFYLGNRTLSDAEKAAADINQDGKVNPFDFLLLKKHILGTYTIGSKVTNASSVPVLLYHHILPDKDKNSYSWRNNNITIATSEFERQMNIIKNEGYTVVTMDALIDYVQGKRTLPEKSVVICFDDGYLSNTYYAAPILRKFNYKATIFAIMDLTLKAGSHPEYIMQDLQHFSLDELEDVSDVFTMQCHTYNNHNHLPEQTYNYIYQDLMLSQKSHPTKYFAYPYGDYNQTVIKAVQAAGFTAAFTTVPRNVVVGDNLFELPRHTITSPMSDNDFRAILTNGEN